jgi:hypothetical protein
MMNKGGFVGKMQPAEPTRPNSGHRCAAEEADGEVRRHFCACSRKAVLKM